MFRRSKRMVIGHQGDYATAISVYVQPRKPFPFGAPSARSSGEGIRNRCPNLSIQRERVFSCPHRRAA